MRVSEVKFQHTEEGPILHRALVFSPGVVCVVMATWVQDPRDGVQN